MNNVIIAFTPLTTPEAARTCPYQVYVDLDSSIYPTTTTAKTYSVDVACGAWITANQKTSITFEKTIVGDTATTGKIRIPAILYPAKKPDPLTENNVLTINYSSAMAEFFGASRLENLQTAQYTHTVLTTPLDQKITRKLVASSISMVTIYLLRLTQSTGNSSMVQTVIKLIMLTLVFVKT